MPDYPFGTVLKMKNGGALYKGDTAMVVAKSRPQRISRKYDDHVLVWLHDNVSTDTFVWFIGMERWEVVSDA